MRGKVSKIVQHYQQTGITPAYAGKSVAYNPAVVFHEDHPRVCGEKCHCA